MPSIIGIIPARYASTRFPGKPLVKILGKTLIQRTYENARAAAWRKVCCLVEPLGMDSQYTTADHLYPAALPRWQAPIAPLATHRLGSRTGHSHVRIHPGL